ncbi:MAG TPA: hypothetical protein DCS66_24320 [Flavobacteriaceae bacterium]|jgi:hypothetical protein|nr:hypothetical protein [Flavobacteriaceae bacterium]
MNNFKLETNKVRNIVVEWGKDKNFVSVVEWVNKDGMDITFDNISTFSLSKSQFYALMQAISRLNLEDSVNEPSPE